VATDDPVRLTFFSELDGRALETLFSDPAVIDRLRSLDACLSLAILDFNDERAAVVRRLNRAGVPVIAWQLLPREQGYWYNMCNAPQAVTRYAEFRDWSAREGLQWSAIGIDIEPDIAELQQLLNHKVRLLRTLLARGCGKKRLCDAREIYRSLVMRMRSDGYPVHSYEFPFMVDEQRAGSSLLRRLLGVSDVPSNKRVLMLYTSFFRPFGPAFLWSYARDAASVGVGITGGGVEMDGIDHPAPLSWEEFARDLRLAAGRCRDIHIFSLEGCVHQGFLERLQGFDWDRPIPPPRPWAEMLDIMRVALRMSLWLASHPVALIVILACVVGLLVFIV
jgi:hypothetical protein